MCFKTSREDNATIVDGKKIPKYSSDYDEVLLQSEEKTMDTIDTTSVEPSKYKESISRMMNTLLKMGNENGKPRSSRVTHNRRKTVAQQIKTEKSTLWKDLFSFGNDKDKDGL